MEKIKLSKVLEIINGFNQHGLPNVFDLEVRSLNRYKKTGGKLKVYQKAKRCVYEKTDKPFNVMGIVLSKPKAFKMPNHKKNRTINLKVPGINNPVKVHKRLITKFNGLEVVY